jgi:hypothetical protein
MMMIMTPTLRGWRPISTGFCSLHVKPAPCQRTRRLSRSPKAEGVEVAIVDTS